MSPSNLETILRYGSLLMVVAHSTMAVLLSRYTRTRGTVQPYLASAAVLSSEICKVVFNIIILLVNSDFSPRRALKTFWMEICCRPRETLKVLIPSFLYALQNNLMYVAISHLDATVFQVTYQLKILMTALFSVCLLKKKILPEQWRALMLLTLGVALVQVSSSGGKTKGPDLKVWDGRYARGLTAVLIACITSGLSGVYFECLVKTGAQTSLVIRNLQLGLVSLVFGLAAVLYKDSDALFNHELFKGFDALVIFMVVLQASGGLMVSVAVKYADNVLKVFATSLSIVLSTICSLLFLGDLLMVDQLFFVGTFLVVIATIAYGKCDVRNRSLKKE